MSKKLYLGVYREIITPPLGGQLYGYDYKIRSSSVHDELTADAFFFAQGETKALLISVSVGSINTNLCNQIREEIAKRLNLPLENCIIAATHTHCGPNVNGMVGWGDIDKVYSESIFIPKLLSCALKAASSLLPVSLGVAVGDSLVGINRREMKSEGLCLGQDPKGFFNPKMTILSFKSDEKIIANLIHYGAHGTATGYNEAITRDWAGAMVDRLEALSGGLTAFCNGPEGDVGPRLSNGLTTGDISQMEELGEVAANDAQKIFSQIVDYREANLKVGSFTLSIPTKARVDFETAKREYEKYASAETNLNAQKKNYYQSVLRSYGDGYTDKATHDFSLSAISLGEFTFLSTPFELFSEIGLKIDEGVTDTSVLTLSNANGSEGYMPTEKELPRGGYEIDMFLTGRIQPFVNNADEHTIKQCIKFLSKK